MDLGSSTIRPIMERRTEFLMRHALGILNLLVAAYLFRKVSALALFVMYALPRGPMFHSRYLMYSFRSMTGLCSRSCRGVQIESESSSKYFHLFSLLSLIISHTVIHASIHSTRVFVMSLRSAFRLFAASRISLDINSFPLTLYLTLPIALLAASIIAMFRNLDLESREDSCMADGTAATASSNIQ